MVGEASAEAAAGGREGVVELVVRIVHLIYLEDSLETAFVES